MSIKSELKKILSISKRLQNKKFNVHAEIVCLAENQLLTGKTALVTGGTSGIGFAIADAMLSANVDKIIITGRDNERCEEAVSKLLAKNDSRQGKVDYIVLDMRKCNLFEKGFKDVQNKLGGKPLTILVNNAGIQGARFGITTEDEYDNVMDTNYKGVFFLSQMVAHYMVDNKIEGNILNVASSSSIRPTNSGYSLSKACIKNLTQGMAKFLIPYGIVVNGIAPGPTATPLMNKDSGSSLYHPSNPSRRFATVEEIASMAVVLCSGIGRMVVGDIVYMTGGAGVITYDDVMYGF